jgi:hypothetical protein
MIAYTISEFWLHYKLWEYKYGPEYQLYVKLYAYFKDYNVQYTCQINDQTLALTETRYGVHLTEGQVREQVSTIIREVISELKKAGSST